MKTRKTCTLRGLIHVPAIRRFSSHEPTARFSLGRPRDRYRVADCAIRGLEVDLFEVDLAYEQEVLTSARNLRQSDIASVQQVLAAERAVELTRQQLELAHQRAERSQQ